MHNPSTPQSGPAMEPAEDFEAWLQPIPETARTRKVSGQFWIWAGANLAPINWVLGALGINLGLGFADTVTVLVLGNLIGMLLFGCFVLLGQKTGATGMVLARAAFGRRGNYLPAAIQALLVVGWCAVNTWIILDLVMALFGTLGWVDPARPQLRLEDRRRHVHHGRPGRHRVVRLQGDRRLRKVDRAAHHHHPGGHVRRRLVRPEDRLDVRRPRGQHPGRLRTHRRHERGDDGHRHRLGHHLVHLRRRLLPLRQHHRPQEKGLPGLRPGPVHPRRLARRPRRQPRHQQRRGRPRQADRPELRRHGAAPSS
jgi:hypothetical protein